MSREYKKYGRKRKKSESEFKTWLVRALTDLGIGIILLLIDRLLDFFT